MGSEGLLLYELKEGHIAFLLIAAASFGNTLGSMVNYYLGLKGETYLENKKVIKKAPLIKAKVLFNKYGAYSLLLSWMPVVGDPITFIAGVLKYDIKKFILLVSLAKTSRYIFIYLLFLNIF